MSDDASAAVYTIRGGGTIVRRTLATRAEMAEHFSERQMVAVSARGTAFVARTTEGRDVLILDELMPGQLMVTVYTFDDTPACRAVREQIIAALQSGDGLPPGTSGGSGGGPVAPRPVRRLGAEARALPAPEPKNRAV